MSLKQLNEVSTDKVRRIISGLDELDWAYGSSKNSIERMYGIPEGTISLWAGQKGIGKSRLAIELARCLTRRGFRVLYFQNEVRLSTFKSWVEQDGLPISDNFYASSSISLVKQIIEIKDLLPHLVIVDSINMIQEFSTGSDRHIKYLIDGDIGYRKICNKIGSHVLFLSQLNKSGIARGSSTLPHLVDIEFKLSSLFQGSFVMDVVKNRYGRSDVVCWWVHKDDKVYPASEFRFEDEEYNSQRIKNSVI